MSMHNIPQFKEAFNKGKFKNTAGVPLSVLQQQSTLVHYILFPSNKDYIRTVVAFIKISAFFVFTMDLINITMDLKKKVFNKTSQKLLY